MSMEVSMSCCLLLYLIFSPGSVNFSIANPMDTKLGFVYCVLTATANEFTVETQTNLSFII
jgi:hypothetical protein